LEEIHEFVADYESKSRYNLLCVIRTKKLVF